MAFDAPVPETVAVPCPACNVTDQVNVAPVSGPVAFSVRPNVVGMLSSDIVTGALAPSVMTGGSFSGWTVTFTMTSSVNVPSLIHPSGSALIELAVAGAAATVVTQNVRDLRGGQLWFPQLGIETPAEFLKRWRNEYGDDDDSTS